MLYTEYISMKNTALHVVGNKLNQDNIILSKNGIRIDSNIEKILSNYFLPPSHPKNIINSTTRVIWC